MPWDLVGPGPSSFTTLRQKMAEKRKGKQNESTQSCHRKKRIKRRKEKDNCETEEEKEEEEEEEEEEEALKGKTLPCLGTSYPCLAGTHSSEKPLTLPEHRRQNSI